MTNKKAKPFLKWAGGKTQLIDEISGILPEFVYNEQFTYIEPFVGSGAFLFWMINNFSNIKKAVINDINEDLINTYKAIKTNPNELILFLLALQCEYHALEGNDRAKIEYYYSKRELYNKRIKDNIEQAALFIFLNRTCFNGLYRVNRNNEFNVPIGSYKYPTICDAENILTVSKALQKVIILCGDFEETLTYAESNTIFYLDPPYKPLNETSNFNSYVKEEFSDSEQIRLRDFCYKLDLLGYTWILSNSDVNSSFFYELYSGFSIRRVDARRSINSKPDKRGILKELLITNQKVKQDYVDAI